MQHILEAPNITSSSSDHSGYVPQTYDNKLHATQPDRQPYPTPAVANPGRASVYGCAPGVLNGALGRGDVFAVTQEAGGLVPTNGLPCRCRLCLFVQGFEQFAYHLRHGNFSTLSLSLQPMQLLIAQSKSEDVFPSHIQRSLARFVVQCGNNLRENKALCLNRLSCVVRYPYIVATFVGAFKTLKTAKHLFEQVLAKTYYLTRQERASHQTHEQNNTEGTQRGSPSHCIVPFRRGRGMVNNSLLPCEIVAGRQGWVYVIHAQGTNRFKIGRSANPTQRFQTLQVQSPYPLKILSSFWSIDAHADENDLHKRLADFRTYGEWFEFTSDLNLELPLVGELSWYAQNPIPNITLGCAVAHPRSKEIFCQKILKHLSVILNKEAITEVVDSFWFPRCQKAIDNLVNQAASIKSYQYIDWLFRDSFVYYAQKNGLSELDDTSLDIYIAGFAESAFSSSYYFYHLEGNE